MTHQTNRRQFLQQTALVSAGFWIAPEILQAASRSPNEKLNIGIIGAGGRGGSNAGDVSSENIVALCDVNENNLNATHRRFPKARTYFDFRKLLDESKDLDAVVVSTTEHTPCLCHLARSATGQACLL